MADPFTAEETSLATQRGWQMYCVYDAKLRSWSHKALPVAFNKECPHVPALLKILGRHAQDGDKLSLRALRLAAAPPFKKEKK